MPSRLGIYNFSIHIYIYHLIYETSNAGNFMDHWFRCHSFYNRDVFFALEGRPLPTDSLMRLTSIVRASLTIKAN